jgi:hypothetical protein
MKTAIAQPVRNTGTNTCRYRGRARCFESWMTVLHQTRKLCRGIAASLTILAGTKWAVTPILMMIADRQLSVGAVSV